MTDEYEYADGCAMCSIDNEACEKITSSLPALKSKSKSSMIDGKSAFSEGSTKI